MPRLSQEGLPEPPEGFVWSDEAARRLSITRRTLWNWRHTGKGPKGQRYHGRLIYPIAALDAHKKAELHGPDLDEEERDRESRPPEPRLSKAA